MPDKNPYDPKTPEWQLYENWKSSQLRVISYSRDAEKAQALAAEAREKAGLYEEALRKLDPRFNPDKVAKEAK